ncbi:MAG: hypothetical protein INR67_18480, partial [Jatrophihabitans endophyticus]
DGAVVGSAALTDGQASVPMNATIVRALTGGLHVIRARYDGSTGFAGSTGLTGVMSPVVSATPTSARPATTYGWWRTPVHVRFSCLALSAPVSCPSARLVTRDGVHHLVERVTASDGGTATVTRTIRLDRTRPTVSVAGARAGHTYGSKRHLTCHARDALSGVASCTVTSAVEHGVVTWTATASDRAGNRATTTGHYVIAGRSHPTSRRRAHGAR